MNRTPAASTSISMMLAAQTSSQLQQVDAAAVWHTNNSSIDAANAVHDRSSATAHSAIHNAIAANSLEYL
jgi:hypothetical protein